MSTFLKLGFWLGFVLNLGGFAPEVRAANAPNESCSSWDDPSAPDSATITGGYPTIHGDARQCACTLGAPGNTCRLDWKRDRLPSFLYDLMVPRAEACKHYTCACKSVGSVCGVHGKVTGNTNGCGCACNTGYSWDSTTKTCASTASGTVSFSPASGNLGSAAPGTGTAPFTVTVTNGLTMSYTGCYLTLSDSTNFGLSSDTACLNLTAGGTCSFQITGMPGIPGIFSTTVNLDCGLVKNESKTKSVMFASVRGGLELLADLISPPAGACYDSIGCASNPAQCCCNGNVGCLCTFASYALTHSACSGYQTGPINLTLAVGSGNYTVTGTSIITTGPSPSTSTTGPSTSTSTTGPTTSTSTTSPPTTTTSTSTTSPPTTTTSTSTTSPPTTTTSTSTTSPPTTTTSTSTTSPPTTTTSTSTTGTPTSTSSTSTSTSTPPPTASCSGTPGTVTASENTCAPDPSKANKKLSCCLSHSTQTCANGLSFNKLDCIQTPATFDTLSPSDAFNQLWVAQDDAPADGGHPYALSLTQRKTGATTANVLTGFYTLKGERCNDLSPFKGKLQRQRVPQLLKTSNDVSMNPGDSAVDLGSAYPQIPGSSELAAANQTTHFPSSIEEKYRCPILVRAALRVKCPQNPNLTITDSTGKVRCSAASAIKIELAIEQLYEIAGQKPMPPIYSTLDEGKVGTLNVKRLIKSP